MFCSKQAIGRWYIFPPHLVSVSTLPCKTKNTKIMSFHLNVVRCFANRYTILFKFHHLVIDRLPFVRKTIDCILKQHQDRAQSTQPSVMYTISIHYVCRGIGAMSITGVVFIEHQWSLSMSYFTTVSQQMLTAIKHVATDNFVLQQDSALVHHAWNTVPLQETKLSTSLFLLRPSPNSREVNIDYKI